MARTRIMAVRMPNELHDWVKREAKTRRTTMTTFVRLILEKVRKEGVEP